MGSKTGDLDLELQGQIGLETKKNYEIPCECNNFRTLGILPSNLRCVDHLLIISRSCTISKTCDLDLELLN